MVESLAICIVASSGDINNEVNQKSTSSCSSRSATLYLVQYKLCASRVESIRVVERLMYLAHRAIKVRAVHVGHRKHAHRLPTCPSAVGRCSNRPRFADHQRGHDKSCCSYAPEASMALVRRAVATWTMLIVLRWVQRRWR